MDAVGTGSARMTMLALAVARVPRDQLKAALARTSDPSFTTPTAVGNALNALARHRDPAALVGRPQYRAALPYLAASIADLCLARTIESLGDHSEDPTRSQLLEAIDDVGASFDDTTIAVMLASVAHGDMPSAPLCYELLDTDPRFGLDGTGSIETEPTASASASATVSSNTSAVDRATREQRDARRAKKEKAAADRRKRAEVARRAEERVRRARKAERSRGRPPAAGSAVRVNDRTAAGPRSARRATLTPAEEAEFDRDDPWVSGVVFAWVPFDSPGPPGPEADGKARRCVVVAGSRTDLLVRPGYSEGGAKSRDWKTVALRSWKQAGFDRPTWIDVHMIRTPRPEVDAPVGWLTPEDWNALW